jgi:hypothetical protein
LANFICERGKIRPPVSIAGGPETRPKDQTTLYHLIQALRKTGNKNEIADLLKRLAELLRSFDPTPDRRLL